MTSYSKKFDIIRRGYPGYETLTIYGKKFNKIEWFNMMKLLWPNESTNCNWKTDFDKTFFEDCNIDMKIQYNISTWICHPNNYNDEFIIGHTDYFLLETLILNSPNILGKIITDLDWFVIPGMCKYQKGFQITTILNDIEFNKNRLFQNLVQDNDTQIISSENNSSSTKRKRII